MYMIGAKYKFGPFVNFVAQTSDPGFTQKYEYCTDKPCRIISTVQTVGTARYKETRAQEVMCFQPILIVKEGS